MSPERYQRLRAMLALRQTDLTLCMEHVHKPHNIAAVVRTCDAVGLSRIHAVWDNNTRYRKGTSKGSQIWVETQNHPNLQSMIADVKQQNMQIIVTHLSDKAVNFREIDYTKPTAILMGQEKTGVTEDALAVADHQVVIPMLGAVQSLNVSVAAALILYEAQHQRERAGLYGEQGVDEQTCQRLLFERGYPELHKMCLRKALPLPQLDDQGQIIASADWWQKMQST